MNKYSRFHVARSLLLLSLAALGLQACGGGPSSPSDGSAGVVVNGSLVGSTGSSSAASSYGLSAHAAAGVASVGTVTVTVQESPNITTTVSSDGSFTLRGLPTGSFTLAFTRDGTPLGTLTFGSVMPNQAVTITVSVNGNSVALVQEQRTGGGHGDLEIEGRVEQVLVLNASGESRFVINQKTVVVRPGQTSIRQGNSQRQVTDVTVGRQVHVKGTTLPMEGSVQPVLASEIKLQDTAGATPTPATSPTPSSSPRPVCIISGGTVGLAIELEGTIVSGNASSFGLDTRAASPVDISAGGATLVCTPASGPNAPTPAQCSASVTSGARVHVSGMLDSCSATAAQVTASRVQVQK